MSIAVGDARAALSRALKVGACAAVLMAACSVAIPQPARAAEAHYGSVVLSDAKDSIKPKEIFAPDTPKIFVTAQLVDVAPGTKLRGAWIAEKTDVAPPNYEIDATDLEIGGGMNQANFALGKPDAGWPVGEYRVDLAINGTVAKSLRFKVEKSTSVWSK
jgi:hypothetical protein